MLKEKVVSLWLGNFHDNKQFVEFMEIKYSEDGDAIPSTFKKNFKIDYYDIDFSEVDWISEGLSSFQELLEGFSYDNDMIPKFTEKYQLKKIYNTIILLYDFEYDGIVYKINDKPYEVEFIGTVQYRK